MGIKDWLNRKGEEKSASNITNDLRKLVGVVREDIEEGLKEADRVVVRQQPDRNEAIQLRARLSYRKAAVTEAQKRLFKNLTIWSTIPPDRALTEIILPMLLGGNIVQQSSSSFEPVIVAAYRVCQAAAQEKGLNLNPHTPPDILEIVNEWGDLYK